MALYAATIWYLSYLLFFITSCLLLLLTIFLVISLTVYYVWDYEFILHYDPFDGWNFSPQGNVVDYHEIEWLQLPIMGAGVPHFYWRSKQIGHLLQPPPADTDPTYVTWLTADYSVMTCLLNSLEKISGSIMTAKDKWDTLKMMYDNEKNPSRVFEVYECLFELKQGEQGDKSVPEFYEELKGLIDESEM